MPAKFTGRNYMGFVGSLNEKNASGLAIAGSGLAIRFLAI